MAYSRDYTAPIGGRLPFIPSFLDTLGAQFSQTREEGLGSMLDRGVQGADRKEAYKQRHEYRGEILDKSSHWVAKGVGWLAGTVADPLELAALCVSGGASKVATFAGKGLGKRVLRGAVTGLTYGVLREGPELMNEDESSVKKSASRIALHAAAFPVINEGLHLGSKILKGAFKNIKFAKDIPIETLIKQRSSLREWAKANPKEVSKVASLLEATENHIRIKEGTNPDIEKVVKYQLDNHKEVNVEAVEKAITNGDTQGVVDAITSNDLYKQELSKRAVTEKVLDAVEAIDLKQDMPLYFEQLNKLSELIKNASDKVGKAELEEIFQQNNKNVFAMKRASYNVLNEIQAGKDFKAGFNTIINNIGNKARGAFFTMTQRVETALEKGKLMHIFKNGIRLWTQELSILNGGKEASTGVAEAKEVARILKIFMDNVVNQAKATGIDIGDLAGRIVTQTHDKRLLKKAGYSEWAKFIRPLLKKRNGVEIGEKSLTKAYNHLIYGSPSIDMIEITGAETLKEKMFSVGASLTKSKKRELHFKDTKSAFAYNEEFGKLSMADQFLSDMKKLQADTSIVNTLGPYPEHTLKYVARKLTEAGTEVNATYVKKLLRTLRLSNDAYNPEDLLARSGAVVRSAFGSSVLGKVALSSIADVAAGLGLRNALNMPALQNLGSLMKSFYYMVAPNERKEMLKNFGTVADIFAKSNSSRMGLDVSGSNKLTEWVYKVTGMKLFNDSMRAATMEAAGMHILKIQNIPFKKLSNYHKTQFLENGISASEWSVIRHSSKYSKGRILLPEDIGRTTDKEMKALFPDAANKLDRLLAIDNIRDKYSGFLHDFASGTLSESNRLTDKFITTGYKSTIDNALAREFVTMWMQFKSYPILFATRVLAPLMKGFMPLHLQEAGLKGAVKAMAKSPKATVATASVMASTVALDYFAMELKDIISGKKKIEDAFKPNKDTVNDVISRSSMLGIYQMGFNLGLGIVTGKNVTREVQDILMPPAFSMLIKTAQIGQKIGDKDFVPTLVDKGSKMIPFANLFYTEQISKKGIADWMKTSYPSYYRKHKRK